MKKRLYITGGLLAVMTGGIYLAFVFSRPVPYGSGFSGSYTYTLLFKPAAWIIPISAFLGIFFRASWRQPKGELKFRNGKILRHDDHMFFAHWSHALSVLILLGSGLVKGPFFLPRLVHTPEAVGFTLNLHFLGVVIFGFGFFYYISDLIIKGSFKELLPKANDVNDAVSYYRCKFFGKGEEGPRQGKFLASEKLAYPGWIFLVGGLVITGGIKVAAHVWSLPSALMGTMTFMHDVCALGILVLLVLHVILGAAVPWSWPLLRSMVTGYVSEEYVQKNHLRWYQELLGNTKG